MAEQTTIAPLGSPAAPLPPTKPARRRGASAERFGLPALLIVLIVVFGLLRPATFATANNFRTIAISQSVLAVTALALIFPLVAGRFDISVGAIVGVSSIATAGAMSKNGLPLAVAVLVGVGLACLIGLVNGVLIAFIGINSIIATIGVSTVLGGLVFAYTQGIPISTDLSPTLTELNTRLVLQIPVLFLIMLVIAGIAWAVLDLSVYGRYLTALGSNERAAALNGLPTRRIVLTSFVCSAGLAGCAGVLQVAAQGNGNPQVGGITFVLPALAAVFLGATTIVPGTYNVPGTIIALFFVGTAVSGLTLMGVQPWITDVFNGVAVVVALALAAVFRRRRTGVALLGQ